MSDAGSTDDEVIQSDLDAEEEESLPLDECVRAANSDVLMFEVGTEMPPTEPERVARMAAVVPLHTITGPIKRGRGRPRKINPKPTVSDLEYHALMTEERARFVEADEVVREYARKLSENEPLRKVQYEMARQAASVKFQRIENEKHGKDSAHLAKVCANILSDLSALDLNIRKMRADVIDLHGEKMQKIFAFFVDEIQKVGKEVLPPELLDVFFNRITTQLDEWEERAEDLVR